MGDNTESLTKLYIDLPNHWAVGVESVWAQPLGDDLYEIRNVPFYAYGLNYSDIVRARSEDPDLKPEVIEVIKENGHSTIRVYFSRELIEDGATVNRCVKDQAASFSTSSFTLWPSL